MNLYLPYGVISKDMTLDHPNGVRGRNMTHDLLHLKQNDHAISWDRMEESYEAKL